jgi:hypothetical protein
VTKVNCPALVTVHTLLVLELKLTVRPELAVADNVGVVPKFCAGGCGNVMVWVPWGVTLVDAAEGEPVPAEFVAVTVKV